MPFAMGRHKSSPTRTQKKIIRRATTLQEVGCLKAETEEDFHCLQIAKQAIKAKRQLDNLFQPKIDTDRIYDMAMLVYDDEEIASNYRRIWTEHKAKQSHEAAVERTNRKANHG